jgi:hypothetical protein
MLGNSWVAEQLVASQEGLNSMKLVDFLKAVCILHLSLKEKRYFNGQISV